MDHAHRGPEARRIPARSNLVEIEVSVSVLFMSMSSSIELEIVKVIDTPAATHIRYHVSR